MKIIDSIERMYSNYNDNWSLPYKKKNILLKM